MSTPDDRGTEDRAPSKPLDPDDPIDRVRINTSKARADHRPARHVDTPDEAVARAHGHRRRLGLTSWIFIALGLGLLCGVLFHYLVPAGPVRDDIFVNGIFYLVGQGFLRLMQMLVVPLVFCSIVCGAASIGDTKTLGSIGVKTILFYLFTTAMAVAVALEAGEYGTFHISCGGTCSRFEFAKTALEYAGLPTTGLSPAMDMGHAYFINLDNLMLRLVGFEPVPDWRSDLHAYMDANGLLAG